MQKTKKLLSLIIAMVMTLGLAVPAFAADTETTYKITISNPVEGHTYEAYQIFSGDLHGQILSNVKWANGQTNHTVGEDATETAETLKVDADAEALANELTLGTAAGTSTFDSENGKYVINNLAPGYYLIKDKDDSLPADKNDAYTKFIVKIVGDAEANPKSAMPTVDKQVLDEIDDAEPGSRDGWGETADHAINEVFQYKLIANIPNNKDLDAYKTYKLVFHDTMSNGITFDAIKSVKVTDINGNETTIEGYTCTATSGMQGGSWTLTIADLVAVISNIKGAQVEVIYDAHLNEAAEISVSGKNENRVSLEYSNNPYADGTGKTAEDIVWVFTFTMDNKKIDGGTKQPLAGAGFRLYDAKGAEIALIYDESISAYRPVKPNTDEKGEEMFSAESTGKFDIKGLDAGQYTLKETTVPGGYNKCNDMEIKIEGYHTEDTNNSSSASCVTTKYMNGDAVNEFLIANNQGAVLPETGGMGTVIFYVIGGVLVAAAVVLIITRKRMSTEK